MFSHRTELKSLCNSAHWTFSWQYVRGIKFGRYKISWILGNLPKFANFCNLKITLISLFAKLDTPEYLFCQMNYILGVSPRDYRPLYIFFHSSKRSSNVQILTKSFLFGWKVFFSPRRVLHLQNVIQSQNRDI